MAKGIEIRAQIDSENVKGLLLINGGAAVALLAFLPSIFGKPNLEQLVTQVLLALGVFQIGLLAAVIHNRLRRLCSLEWEKHAFQPPRCKYQPAWWKQDEPCVCARSVVLMYVSLASFVTASLLVLWGGWQAKAYVEPTHSVACWQVQALYGNAYRINQCAGSFERVELC